MMCRGAVSQELPIRIKPARSICFFRVNVIADANNGSHHGGDGGRDSVSLSGLGPLDTGEALHSFVRGT